MPPQNITVVGSSLPSTPIMSVDVPEVTGLAGKFVYNFYAQDELTNDQTLVTAPADSVGFSRMAPRYNQITWRPVVISSTGLPQPQFVSVSIEANAPSVIDEDSLGLKWFQNLEQQEPTLVAQTQVYLSELYQQQTLNRTDASLSDAYRALHEATPEDVTQEFLARYLDWSRSQNIIGSATTLGPESFTTVVPINNKTLGTLLYEKLTNDTLTPLTTDLADAASRAFQTQQAVGQYTARIDGTQYDLGLANPVSTRLLDEVPTYTGTAFQTTGYIVDRYRVQESDGQSVEKKTFYLESPETTQLNDTEIRYNQRYVYVVRAVAAIETTTFDPGVQAVSRSVYLVASKRTKVHVRTVDTRPSRPPTDFFVGWDQRKKKPVLTWNFPVDTRRHIKYFQVFRRKNLGTTRPAQVPFELVAMYDFSDLYGAENVFWARQGGLFGFVSGEGSISNNLVLRSTANTPGVAGFVPTSYTDEDFNKEDYYIYAVAAVDAHGVSSNYSNQLGVKFNKLRNTIDLVDVSSEGAPKPYPNLFINKDAFIDTIKNEGYSQFTVVFNPDYYDLRRTTGETVDFLRFGPDNFYRVQLINTDLQTDQTVDIKIMDDRR